MRVGSRGVTEGEVEGWAEGEYKGWVEWRD